MAALVEFLAFAGARKSNGDPVASGRAFFYQPGTVNTQVQVYSDKDGLVGLAQPVALDAGGRAVVYTKLPVRVEVQQAVDNAVVRVEDRVNTLNAQQVEIEHPSYVGTSLVDGTQVAGGRTTLHTVLGGLGGTAGSTDGKHYLESVGATQRTVQAAIGDKVTFQDFGALGDGITNDTTAITSAVARALASNKPLWIEPGTYVFTGPIAISGATAAGLRIMGANRAACILRNTSGTANAITVDLGSAVESDMEMSDFTISNSGVSTGKAIEVLNGNGISLRRISCSGHTTGFETSAVTGAMLEDLNVVSLAGNASSRGIKLGTACVAHRCRVTDATSGRGIQFNGQNSRADMCRVAAAAGTAYDMLASDSVCFGCTVSGVAAYGFYVGAVSRSGCVGCVSTGSTNDYATDSAASTPMDVGNIFTTRSQGEAAAHHWMAPRAKVVRKNIVAVSGATPSFTPDLTKGEYQVVVVTHTNSSTLTINATSTTGLVDGQQMKVVIEAQLTQGSGYTVTPSWNAQYTGHGNLSQTISERQYRVVGFIWRAAASAWVVEMEFSPGIGNATADWST